MKLTGTGEQVYVMGPITILVRRPSLRLPIAAGDLLEEVGDIQSVGRVSAYHSESEFGAAPQWDPPHWAIQSLAQELRNRYGLSLFNFDLIQPDRSQQNGTSISPALSLHSQTDLPDSHFMAAPLPRATDAISI